MDMSGVARSPGSDAEDTFDDFVRGRSTDLFRLALVLTGWDKAAAEDVLQVALERAFRRWRALVRDGAPEPYVRRVVVNAALDWRRAVRRRREGALDIAAGMTVEDRTDQIGDRDALVRVLAVLAPKQRAVLVMRYWVDLSDGEIAATLNCSTATVRSQASRGLARLRELTATPADGAGQSRRVEHNERS